MIDLVVAAAAVGFWVLVYAFCRLLTRPASPAAAPATMELGAESPALVSLLVNRWSLTEDAAESTLLDLAARRFFELRQPGDDPMRTTVHLSARPPASSDLAAYESQVLERIRGLSVDGVVPITALTFRNAAESARWNKRLRQAVLAEARAAGLSRRRISKTMSTLLSVLAAGVGVVVGFAALRYGFGKPEDDQPPAFAFGFFTFAVLSTLGARSLGERDTPAGRAAASRWLGVRDWLRGHDQFASLPPAAVAVWDRYLAYGAAVGVTRLASAVLDLEMGDKRLVWSSFGGTWHRVRVRYPRFWPRYGRPLPHLLLRAAAYLLAGGLILRLFGALDYFAAPAVLLLALGAYVLIRSLLDLAFTREITGEVLWRESWKSKKQSDDSYVTWLFHLAVDDGSGDRTTAWGLPAAVGSGVRDGDTVTITVRPWSRRIVKIVTVGHGRSREIVDTVTEEETGSLSLTMMPAVATPLFSDETVAQVVGRAVVSAPLPLGLQYNAADTGKPMVLVQSLSGLPGKVAWRANQRGAEVPGGAFVAGDRAAFRRGETTYVVTLMGEGRAGRPHLPWLVAQAR
ncbi:DUF2207 family protein [Paractinoplanes rhizophilus]|uniref:DUF2207 family protein n=1 Tax=Paractinoplanes rhizophilus TaxID=1416877 RepID=A0ABW2HJI3_9ACTN